MLTRDGPAGVSKWPIEDRAVKRALDRHSRSCSLNREAVTAAELAAPDCVHFRTPLRRTQALVTERIAGWMSV